MFWQNDKNIYNTLFCYCFALKSVVTCKKLKDINNVEAYKDYYFQGQNSGLPPWLKRRKKYRYSRNGMTRKSQKESNRKWRQKKLKNTPLRLDKYAIDHELSTSTENPGCEKRDAVDCTGRLSQGPSVVDPGLNVDNGTI